jgi:FkbM family methyltransferase
LLVAIEANPHLARLVHYSLAINGLLRWGEVHNVAAGSAAGIVELIYDPHMPGGGAIRPASTRVAHPSAASAKETRTVPVCAIDALLGERRKRINVVKMDIEGAEAQAFEGMRQLLVEARPLRILLEYNGHGKHIADGFRKLQPLLEAEGFEPLQVLNEAQLKPTTWDDLIAKAERQDIVVARKDDRGWISIA